MKKLWIILFPALILTACSGKSDASKEASESERVYNVGTFADFKPFTYIDSNGEIIGYEVDLMDAIAKEMGIKYRMYDYPFESIFNSLKNRDIDFIIAGVTITDARKENFLFSDPYFKANQLIISNDPNDPARTMQDIKDNGLVVGVLGATTGDLIAQKILGQNSDKIKRLNTTTLVMDELANGGVNVVVIDNAPALNYMKENQGKNFVTYEDPEAFEDEYYGMVFNKGDEELVRKVNEVFKKLRESGELKRIDDKWFNN